ncbi:MAG: response regulator [Kiritimatiellae bacterium]|nr:response regulator [Kiritimatiellia bacterium]
MRLPKMNFHTIDEVLRWVGVGAIVLIAILVLRLILRGLFGRGRRNVPADHPVLEHMKHPRELPGGKERILLVDDDPTTLQVNSRILTGLGYEVVCAKSGEEAIEYVKQIPVDLLLLDLVMDPGIDGVETYRRVLQVNPKQRAVILSGYAQPSQVEAAQKLGATKYLIKPAPAGTLAQAIRDEIDRA